MPYGVKRFVILMKKAGIIMYAVIALLSFVTIITGYGEVSENLDGWHNFSGGYAFLFVLICLLLICGCIYNIRSLSSNSAGTGSKLIGIAFIVLPLLFHFIAVTLQGNVDTDLQYLLLRTFQGFDYTYIYLCLASIAGCVTLLFSKKGDVK